jgi:hypothetical protein
MRHLFEARLWRSLFMVGIASEAPGGGPAGDPKSSDDPTPNHRRALGPLGPAARLVLGGYLVGSVVYGQLATHYVRPATWALGLIGFPALVLAWHAWRIHRHPTRFHDDSLLSFVLGVLLFVALYFTWWYAPALSVTSDAALIFFGGAMLLTALRGDAGCEILTPSNWLLRRHDQIACALFAPIDALERRRARR